MSKEVEHKDSEKNYSSADLNKKILDGTFLYPTQSHSRAFWQILFDGKDWEDGKGKMISNIEYLKSKLNANERNEFDQYIKVSNENVSNSSVRSVYFIYKVASPDLVGKIRRKKYFDEDQAKARWKGSLDESFYEFCSYQAQEQQAQIQVPPK
ncbi:9822_t:CDS:2 [Ambispora leptoticha]|uniref:9822_t:CDS:1 n=1 Tax=Ambispora leptoticha TaxID=144679 RepID=A0A9N9GV59_9GLOM|nr:9822_t:CDS:2 [Ambispora leptoticha]